MLNAKRDNWIVYVGIHNKEDDLIVYNTIIEACLGMIRRLTAADEQKEKIITNAFLDKVLLPAKMSTVECPEVSVINAGLSGLPGFISIFSDINAS